MSSNFDSSWQKHPQGIGNNHFYAAHHISILRVRTVPCKNEQRFLRYGAVSNVRDTALHCPRPVVTE